MHINIDTLKIPKEILYKEPPTELNPIKIASGDENDTILIFDDMHELSSYPWAGSAVTKTALTRDMINIGNKGDKVWLIMIDKSFFNLLVDERLALLHHEIGHINLGHLDNMKRTKFNSIARLFGYIKIEYEADRYAASFTSSVIAAGMIRSARDIIGANRRECSKRIKKLLKIKGE